MSSIFDMYIEEGFVDKIRNKKFYKDHKSVIDSCIAKANDLISKKKYCKKLTPIDFRYGFNDQIRVYIGTVSILELYRYVYKEDPKKAGERGGQYPKLEEELDKLEAEITALFKDENIKVRGLIDYLGLKNYFNNWDEDDWQTLYEDLKNNPWGEVHNCSMAPDIDLIIFTK